MEWPLLAMALAFLAAYAWPILDPLSTRSGFRVIPAARRAAPRPDPPISRGGDGATPTPVAWGKHSDHVTTSADR